MRHVVLVNNDFLIKKTNNKLILHKNKNFSGRNNSGRITVFSKGTRHARKYILLDYKRLNKNVPGILYLNQYDANRSSFISLILYKNNICCYIIGIHNLNIGSTITSYSNSISLLSNNEISYKKGDSNKLIFFTTGSIIHNVEYLPNKGGIFIRSSGTYGKIIKKYFKINKVLVELPSKTKFYTSLYSNATLGIVGNILHNKISLGKAGRSRWLGKKSTVRGVAMNPIDHPHGGGEGKKSNPSFKRSPWGKILKWQNKKELFINK